MVKSRAALAHLWPSLLVLAIIAGMILFIWYPYPFLQFKDTGKFSLMLVLSAGFIGPAMTWLFYRKGKSKRALAFDLIVILLIQTAAFAWGGYALYQNRPYFMVFTVDRFEVLTMRDVDLATITDSKLLNKPLAGPILLYASMPAEPQAFQKFIKEVMFEGKPDLQFRAEFWSLYAEKQQLSLSPAQSLETLRSARPESLQAIDKLVKNNGGDINRLKYVPGMAQNGQFAAILDADSGEVIDTLVIDPWVK
jgi:signal transduction histidine kinase